jgi:hypothetical protein
MNRTWLVAATLGLCVMMFAQNPMRNIDPRRHGNLAHAQEFIVQACEAIDSAQKANEDRLGGHAEKAKALLVEADRELRLAANVSNEEHR